MTKRIILAGVLLGLSCFSLSSGPLGRDVKSTQLIAPRGETRSLPNPANMQIKADPDYGRLPLYFIPNKGQLDARVAYYVQGKDKTLYFTPEGITFALVKAAEKDDGLGNPEAEKAKRADRKGSLLAIGSQNEKTELDQGQISRGAASRERWAVKLGFIGANPGVQPVGNSETGAVVSYFRGHQEEWHAGLPTYSQVTYPDLWPGVDLVYYGTVNRLKYEFVVRPGADPSSIRLAYRGVDGISVDDRGRLNIHTPAGDFQDDAPVAYQEKDGKRTNVRLAYELAESCPEGSEARADSQPASPASSDIEAGDRSEYGFSVGNYDSSEPLILDPAILVYCGFIGGSSGEDSTGIAVDSSGNAYVTGYTWSTETSFPVATGPDLTYNGTSMNSDAFVAKVNNAGTRLDYCGYIGGTGLDYAYGIAVDGAGNAYVLGTTGGSNFPVLLGPDLTPNGEDDAFVAKVNSSGTALVYCGYIGGAGPDSGYKIAVDGSGAAYVAGSTDSSEATFPVMIGPNLIYNGSGHGFVAKVDPAGTGLVYCGYLPGGGGGIAVDKTGNAYVTGTTGLAEPTFPALLGPDLSNNGGPSDAYVAKINAAGTGFIYCGYIGGAGQDEANSLAVDGIGNAYVMGYTWSDEATFPVTVGPDLTYNGGPDAFVAKINTTGTGLIYCGYIGSVSYGVIGGNGIAVDESGNAYIDGSTGQTQATFPVLIGPDLTYNGGSNDVYVAKINPAGAGFIYNGYIGGSSDDRGASIAVDASGNAYVSGITWSNQSTFPVLVGPDLTYNSGIRDAFVAKIYSFDIPSHKRAVGDYDGDGADELAGDFGAMGAWIYDKSSWFQITTVDSDNLIPFDGDGDRIKEIALDLGSWGIWMWDLGVWTPLDPNDAEYLIAADPDGNGIDELIIDRGAQGLWWMQESGVISSISPLDPQDMMAVDTDGDGSQEILVDFGPNGLWAWDSGNWTELSGADALTMVRTDVDGNGTDEIAVGFGSLGLWLRGGGDWGPLTGLSPDKLVSGKMASGWGEEIVGNFGVLGVWSWQRGVWGQLSGENAEGTITADTDGDGVEEVAADFSMLGLWLWEGGTWVELTGNNPEGTLAADTDGDGAKELVVDFGPLGVWLWDGGNWSQIKSDNPD